MKYYLALITSRNVYFHLSSVNFVSSGNPFFNCLGFKPKAIEKRLQRKAGKWIAKMPKPFASNKKAKLHYFQSIFDGLIDFL